MPFPAIFRFFAWLFLIGGLAGAALGFAFSGFAAGLVALAGAAFGFVLWRCLAWSVEALATAAKNSEETARLLARMARSDRADAAATAGDVAVDEGWPTMLAYLLPVAAHNGVELQPAARGRWRAVRDGDATVYSSAAECGAWLKTLPKP